MAYNKVPLSTPHVILAITMVRSDESCHSLLKIRQGNWQETLTSKGPLHHFNKGRLMAYNKVPLSTPHVILAITMVRSDESCHSLLNIRQGNWQETLTSKGPLHHFNKDRNARVPRRREQTELPNKIHASCIQIHAFKLMYPNSCI